MVCYWTLVSATGDIHAEGAGTWEQGVRLVVGLDFGRGLCGACKLGSWITGSCFRIQRCGARMIAQW